MGQSELCKPKSNMYTTLTVSAIQHAIVILQSKDNSTSVTSYQLEAANIMCIT